MINHTSNGMPAHDRQDVPYPSSLVPIVANDFVNTLSLIPRTRVLSMAVRYLWPLMRVCVRCS